MSTYVPPPPPPPPQQRQNSGCFKWGAAGCGGCVLLLILSMVGMYFALGPKGRAFITGTITDSVQVAKQMQELRAGILRYKTDKGQYPEKLEDLVPRYVGSPAMLKLSTHPEGPTFKYFKPGPHSQQDDILLEYDLSITTPDGATMVQPIRIQIDGRTRQGTSHSESPSSGGSSGTSAGRRPTSSPGPAGD